MILINRSKAESITLDRLRTEREARLADLDLESLKALVAGEDTTAIVAQKQALLDVTDKDLSGLTLDALAALTLDEAVAL